MQEEGYKNTDPACVVCKRPMTYHGMYTNQQGKTFPMWVCHYDGTTRAVHETNQDVVAHDDSVESVWDLTPVDFKLLVEALEIAVTCKEVEVDVAQAEADAKADTLRDLIVLKRKLETA